jgi:hypothetical protein
VRISGKSKWPVLLLLAIGAVRVRADIGYSYAWIPDGANPSVGGNYSLNPFGEPTVVHNGTGQYTMSFPGLPLTNFMTLAASFASNAYCNIGTPYAQVACFNIVNGLSVPADSAFSVVLLTGSNDKGISFAFADQPTEASYPANASFSYNAGNAINVTRSGVGTYQVAFSDLNNAPGGTVQVDAAGGNSVCNSSGWSTASSTFTANVSCFTAAGNPADSQFVIAVIPGGTTPSGAAYAQVTNSSPASSTFSAPTTYNPTGRGVSVTHASTGNYQLTFTGLNAAQLQNGGNVRATADSSTARCGAQWGPGPGSSLLVPVTCIDLNGNPVDTQFEVFALPAMGYAYATFLPTSSPAITWVNPGGPQVTSVRNAPGSYTVTFPNSGIDLGWGVQAQSAGTDGS